MEDGRNLVDCGTPRLAPVTNVTGTNRGSCPTGSSTRVLFVDLLNTARLHRTPPWTEASRSLFRRRAANGCDQSKCLIIAALASDTNGRSRSPMVAVACHRTRHV